jgi:hypothetical protein
MFAILSMTQVAAYDRNTMEPAEMGEPDASLDAANPGRQPDTFNYPRQPFEGIRAVVSRLVHHDIPGVPGTPPKVVADRGGDLRPGGRAHNPTRVASNFVAVQGVNQTAGWWESYDTLPPGLGG